MAGDWIKMRSNIKDDPDVVVMAGILKIDEFATVGRLHAVWAWLDQHSQNGTNVRITGGYLDRLTACAGFADAMRAVDWLRGDDGDLEFPNFDRHNGDSAKRRCQDSKRKNNARLSADKAEECPQDVRLNADKCPKKIGPEKRREENINTNPLTPLQGDVSVLVLSDQPPAGEPKSPAQPAKGELQLRAERLMRRRPETPPTENEARAFRRSKDVMQATTEEQWQALERYYAAPQSETYSRKDLATLLNNWNGEIDRALVWMKPPASSTLEERFAKAF